MINQRPKYCCHGGAMHACIHAHCIRHASRYTAITFGYTCMRQPPYPRRQSDADIVNHPASCAIDFKETPGPVMGVLTEVEICNHTADPR